MSVRLREQPGPFWILPWLSLPSPQLRAPSCPVPSDPRNPVLRDHHWLFVSVTWLWVVQAGLKITK